VCPRGGPDGGGGRLGGQPVGGAGVHPAEQRLDEGVHHLATEPLADQVTDAAVTGHEPSRQDRLHRRPQDPAGGQHPRPPHGAEVGRGAEHRPLRQRSQTAPDPQRDPSRRGCDELVAEPELADEALALGLASQERVGPHVEPGAGERHRADLAPGAVVRLDDDHLGERPGAATPSRDR
jgi:hypothetical protein